MIRAGGTVGDDDVWSPLAVQVLAGSARASQQDRSVDLPTGGLVWLFANVTVWFSRAVTKPSRPSTSTPRMCCPSAYRLVSSVNA